MIVDCCHFVAPETIGSNHQNSVGDAILPCLHEIMIIDSKNNQVVNFLYIFLNSISSRSCSTVVFWIFFPLSSEIATSSSNLMLTERSLISSLRVMLCCRNSYSSFSLFCCSISKKRFWVKGNVPSTLSVCFPPESNQIQRAGFSSLGVFSSYIRAQSFEKCKCFALKYESLHLNRFELNNSSLL